MIWLIGGTSETPLLACKLVELGYKLVVTTTTLEGARLLKSCTVKVQVGALDKKAMEEFVFAEGVQVVIDASHPYATLVSENAMAVCKQLNLPYIRYERPELALPVDKLIYRVATMEEAASLAFELGTTVFTTTGVKDLPVFVKKRDQLTQVGLTNLRLIVKILPVLGSIQACQNLRIEMQDIFAVYGTFSTKFYQAIIQEYKIDVLVSKESGQVGGILEKVEACLALGKPLIFVMRPKLQYPKLVSTLTDLEYKLEKVGVKC